MNEEEVKAIHNDNGKGVQPVTINESATKEMKDKALNLVP
jgi:hypothetical protein